MALGFNMKVGKWVKPFIVFLCLSLASILAYENLTSRMESGTTFVDNGVARNSKTREQKSQTPTVAQTTLHSSNKGRRLELQQATVSMDSASHASAPSPSPSARMNATAAVTSDAWNSSLLFNACQPTTNCSTSGSSLPNGRGEGNQSVNCSLLTSRENANCSEGRSRLDSSASSEALGEVPVDNNNNNNNNNAITRTSKPMLSNLSVSTNIPQSFPNKTMPARKPNMLLSRIFSAKDALLGDDRTRSKDSKKKNREKPVFIVLLARMRTGSTLIGEIFNQNPDVGFLYEPLHALCDWTKRGIMEKSKFGSTATNLFEKLSQCEFPPNFISSIVTWPVGGGFRSSLINPVCAITKSCKHASSKMLRHYCMKFQKYRGVKTIRADLDILRPLVEKGAVDVKILHLIRDPRGTANSRRHVYYQDSTTMQRRLAARGFRGRRTPINGRRVVVNGQQIHGSIVGRTTFLTGMRGTRLDAVGLMDTADVFPLLNTVPAYCRWLKATTEQVRKRPAWLRGRYKMIRYEDFADHPLRVTEDVYRHFDMVLPDGVRHWVANNTSGDIASNDRLYGSHRNSSGAAFKWRKEMLTTEAMQVEKECGDIMEQLGYITVSHGKVRLADLQQSLIRPLPDDILTEL